eukprot:jgi/Botrbrau1/3405/Bobra.0337s0041.1
MIHDVLAHPGVSQTLVVLHQHIHWPRIKADVELFVRTCEPCQKLQASLPEPPRLQKPALFGPMDHVHIDLFGPVLCMLARDHDGVQDRKKIWVVLMIEYFIEMHGCRCGVLAVVTSDNGNEGSTDFMHMLLRLGIYQIQISPNHPSANGLVERLVKTAKEMLTKHYNDFPTHRSSSLHTVHLACMSRKHSSICNFSPTEMLYGFTPKLPIAVREVPVNVDRALSFEHQVCRLHDRLREQYDQVARCIRS